MIKTIFLLLTVLLSFTVFLSANAQTPELPYIILDKPEYFYGDVIQATGYFEVVDPNNPDGYVAIEGAISEDLVLPNTRTFIDLQTNTMSFSFDTVNLVPFEHASFPHDGIYTMQMRYVFNDPISGTLNRYVTIEFEYNTYDYNPTQRMDALEGNVTGLQQDVLQNTENIMQNTQDVTVIQQDITVIDTSLTTINGTLTTAQQDILDLQNAPALPPDLLARINALETEVAKITTIESTQSILSDSITQLNERISNMELEISDLDTTQNNYGTRITTIENNFGYIETFFNDIGRLDNKTNNLQTQVDSIDNDIMMMGLDVSSLHNDLDNPEGLWSRVNDLQTDVTQIQTEITTIVNENSTPQDVEQNLRMDGIESNITNLFTANQTQSNQIDETDSRQFGLFTAVNALQTTAWDNTGRIITVETDVDTLDSRTVRVEQGIQDNLISNLGIYSIIGNLDEVNDENTISTQLSDIRSTVSDNQQTDTAMQGEIDILGATANNNYQMITAVGTGMATNQNDIRTINQKITGLDTKVSTTAHDLSGLAQVVDVDHTDYTTKIASLNNKANQHKTAIEAFVLEHREFQSRIDGFNAHLLTVDGQVQALRTDVINIQSTPHPINNAQVQFLDQKIIDIEIKQGSIENRVVGNQQSIMGFIQEHIQFRADIDHNISEILKLWEDMPNILSAP